MTGGLSTKSTYSGGADAGTTTSADVATRARSAEGAVVAIDHRPERLANPDVVAAHVPGDLRHPAGLGQCVEVAVLVVGTRTSPVATRNRRAERLHDGGRRAGERGARGEREQRKRGSGGASTVQPSRCTRALVVLLRSTLSRGGGRRGNQLRRRRRHGCFCGLRAVDAWLRALPRLLARQRRPLDEQVRQRRQRDRDPCDEADVQHEAARSRSHQACNPQ